MSTRNLTQGVMGVLWKANECVLSLGFAFSSNPPAASGATIVLHKIFLHLPLCGARAPPAFPRTHPAHVRRFCQVFLACGVMVLVFELFAVPHLTPRLGVRMSQRVGSVVLVPVYIFLPMLSSVNGAHLAVTVASLILLFTCFVCSHAVSASNRRDGEHKQVRVSTDCKLSAAASVKNTHPHSRHTFRCCRTFSRACVSALVSELVAYSVHKVLEWRR